MPSSVTTRTMGLSPITAHFRWVIRIKVAFETTLPGGRGCRLRVMATHAPGAPSRPATELSPAQQKAFYEDRGYLVFPELLSLTELATLRAALAEVLAEAEGL